MKFQDKQPIISLLEPLAPTIATGRNDLADEAVVELLVRGYVDKCLEAFQQAMTDAVTQDEAVDSIYRLASALNAVFLGQTGFDTIVVHGWNSPEQLGAFLRDTLDFDFPPEECVRATLVHMATHVMYALQGSQPDWKDQVDSLVAEVRDLLLGRLPAGEEPPVA
ncbi:MAG TPA: hypothetical protein VD995_25745 [Azospirillum sp.]|nr:hypothetical protein [Azospirillum sp.]